MVRTKKVIKQINWSERLFNLVFSGKSLVVIRDILTIKHGVDLANFLYYFMTKSAAFGEIFGCVAVDRQNMCDYFKITSPVFSKRIKIFKDLGILENKRVGVPKRSGYKINEVRLYKELCVIANSVSNEEIPQKTCPNLTHEFLSGDIYIIIMDILLKDYKYIIDINNIIEDVEVNRHISPRKLTIAAKERSKEYLPYAKKLARTVRKHRHVTHTDSQMTIWSNEFRRLIESHKVSTDRIEKVLTWYRSNIGGKYIPVAHAGRSFREKFSRLEAAMERGIVKEVEEKEKTARPRPMKIIRRMGKELPQVELDRIIKAFKELRKLISNCDQNKLSINLCNLHKWIISARDKADFKTERSNDVGTPGSLLVEFVWWLEHQDWLSNISESIFKSDSKLFKRFLTEYGEELGVNLLTGKY